jgi:hypothetical protein
MRDTRLAEEFDQIVISHFYLALSTSANDRYEGPAPTGCNLARLLENMKWTILGWSAGRPKRYNCCPAMEQVLHMAPDKRL